MVLVDDADMAEKSYKRVRHRLTTLLGTSRLSSPEGLFRQWNRPATTDTISTIAPWGWDSALKSALLRKGYASDTMPSDDVLADIRQLSHRRTAAAVLHNIITSSGDAADMYLFGNRLTGISYECTTVDEVCELLSRHQQIVAKAPWSSSGRGLRFLDKSRNTISLQEGWLRNVIARQGSVMVEPYYNKVKDFGMEFEALVDGSVNYLGLSLFHTSNGQYAGNILATEVAKRQMISRYISPDIIDLMARRLACELSATCRGRYQGPLGVDMMVVAEPDGKLFLLHPCVEINMRRTMGHVALSLHPASDELSFVMRTEYANNYYQLKSSRL